MITKRLRSLGNTSKKYEDMQASNNPIDMSVEGGRGRGVGESSSLHGCNIVAALLYVTWR